MPSLSDLSTLPPVDDLRGRPPNELFAELVGVITAAIDGDPRSAQTRLGPSEIGIACGRRLAHKLAGTPVVNPRPGAWRPTVGKAVHEWLAGVFAEANRDQAPRWLVEFKVEAGVIGDNVLDGNCDLYDRSRAMAVDWKVVGSTALKKYRLATDPGPQYRVQAHTYGLGWTRRGLPVDHVAVVFLPAEGELSQAVFWHEPYQPHIAVDAIARADALSHLVTVAGSAAVAMLPTADSWCAYCPWFLPAATDLTEACPGHVDADLRVTA